MINVRLTIQYDGTNYAGWQRQKNAVSIQQIIEEAIFSITKEKVNLISSGRTDSGVHALEQVANFLTNTKIPLKSIPKAINSKLPPDIRIISADEVSLDFHSRYSAIKKRYKYIMTNFSFEMPLYRNYAYNIPYKLDIEKMKQQAKSLIGTHDFVGFMGSGSSVKDTVRTIYDIDLYKKDDFIILEVEGNGFLYNMVRIIVGTLVDIGRGKINEDLTLIIESKDRNKAGHTAPAKGLFLKKVYY
ncbi:tRNA pseudouridine38-40 synthase [Alkalithermobacter thermoalcaliphilus JW-YL-7 = DSM 7308]|uniref:tRNA pseudouridine synthase A n=1 Tax=Alkalithermobacter thermoalcaliphilus JW-YL-7 = DSM 7308 TaxID=1121328 RepID=A0A150FPC2_CLOPD|nr:tRNA pseudouridine synthase A [[Clostridium] paradoxum JW-YL-7 = DSM 7308]SHL24297.1 tRNA pseudouridine38-40 synthase [[Clostridium] paradoxum JW-YL-7 = DSM 7308]